MRSSRFHRVFVAAVFLAAWGWTGCGVKVEECDRQCLDNLMHRYIEALVQHDPGSLPFADSVKFTENTEKGIEVLEVGKGLWETATEGPRDYRIFAADPEGQAAACLVVMKEKDQPVMLGARIKLEAGKITEAEHLIVRGGGSMPMNFSGPNLLKSRPGFDEDIPEAERMKREDLVRIGLAYYDALTSEDGTRAPFAKECERRENGMVTAGGPPPKAKAAPGGAMPTGGFGGVPTDCEGQLSAGVFSYITEIRPRLVVADVQKGLAVGFSMFRHDGTRRPPREGVTGNTQTYGQFNLAAVHVYKIRNGKLYEIEAPGAVLPYNIPSHWEAEEKVYPQPK